MTAVAEDLGIWLDDEAQEAGGCEGVGGSPCSNEAICLMVWKMPCDHPDTNRACLFHRDFYLKWDKWPGIWKCHYCEGEPCVILRIEPLR